MYIHVYVNVKSVEIQKNKRKNIFKIGKKFNPKIRITAILKRSCTYLCFFQFFSDMLQYILSTVVVIPICSSRNFKSDMVFFYFMLHSIHVWLHL